MKLKNRFFALVAIMLGFLTGCEQPEEMIPIVDIHTDGEEIYRVDKTGGTVSFNIYSDEEWTLETKTFTYNKATKKWIESSESSFFTIQPGNGNGGGATTPVTVEIKPESNDQAPSKKVVAYFRTSTIYAAVAVIQLGLGGDGTTIEKISVADFNAAEEDDTYYELTGEITNIANTTYGNFYLTDETGTVYVYGLLPEKGGDKTGFSTLGLKVGDIVTIHAQRGSFGTTIEALNAYYVSHTEGQAPAIVDATVAEFLAAAEDSQQYRLTGLITEVASSTYGNIYIQDATGKVYIYGVLDKDGASKNWAGIGANVGDVITLTTIRTSHKETPQGKNAQYESHWSATESTISDFLAAPVDGSKYYKLTGTVKNIKDGDTYGNFDIEDETGSVYVYGLLSGVNGAKKLFQQLVASVGLKNGDKLTLYGTRGDHKGTAQVANGFYVSHVEGTATDPDPGTDPGTGTATHDLKNTLVMSGFSSTNASYRDTTSTINGVANCETAKIGKSQAGGHFTVVVPKGSTKLCFYGIAWNGTTTPVAIKNGSTVLATVETKSNAGATGNPPYTITVTDDAWFEVAISESALTADTEITLSTEDKAPRAILFGICAK